MKVKYNKDGTVSVYSIPESLFDAINAILSGVEYSFDENNEGDFECDGVSVCIVLSPRQKKILEDINWYIC